MGYSHALYEGKMFIPTKHYHAHVHIPTIYNGSGNVVNSMSNTNTRVDNFTGMRYDASNIDNSPMFANNGLGFPSNNIGQHRTQMD